MIKRFHISDVLSISTGRFVSSQVDSIYDIMGHITGEPGITTIGLAAMAEPCRQHLLRSFPELSKVKEERLDELLNKESDNETACNTWVNEMIELLEKEYFDVPSMPIAQPRRLEDDLDYFAKVKYGNN